MSGQGPDGPSGDVGRSHDGAAGRHAIEDVLNSTALLAAVGRMRPDREPSELLARVVWNTLAEPGDGTAGAIVSALGPEEALHVAFGDGGGAWQGAERPAARVLAEARRRWVSRLDPGRVEDAMDRAFRCGARLLAPGDAVWPVRLDDLQESAPHVLWVRGSDEALGRTGVAIVGARAASAYGEHVAAEFAGDLAGDGLVVVSGGAYGIDGAAHRAALGVDGETVAVLAGGVDRAYPAGHSQLFGRIVENGAVISELPCGAAPTRWRFLARNRVIGALAAATVVVEAGWRSGSLNTAGHAAALGRPLGAVPGPVTSSTSAGCHRLLREYDAQCVTTAAEVRELLGPSVSLPPGALEADPDLIGLRDALSGRAFRDVQELARRSGLSRERVEALLGMLELDGGAVRGDGGWRGVRG
ncbi:DNA processing protein [Microbacterium resistens]|uniref:DNA processing protein n=1 Tax=Microbacterium resistens TaxID=156977 RepID=A0ABU1S8T4_9MICO|nr:DNA-processing protein DprA [Microbacterium resistens]MDR6865996.1 DNA processing protein [Microbacterium resistens]